MHAGKVVAAELGYSMTLVTIKPNFHCVLCFLSAIITLPFELLKLSLIES
jgi:hypothetical protein